MCQPEAVTSVHQHLQPVAAAVGMVRLCRTMPLHYLRQQTISTGTHIHRHRCQPPRIAPDHRSQSRSQTVQSLAA